ncbi:MAG: discoidin domain-containing protein [Bacteroidales bacterium]
MKSIQKILFFLSLSILFGSCEKDDDKISDVTLQGIKAEAFPGAIRLSWNAAETTDFLYAEVSYWDFAKQKTVTTLCSRYTDNLYIDGLLNKYGKYKFIFTAYDMNKTPGQPIFIERQCEKASSYYVITEENVIPLNTDQLGTNAQEPSEGPISNLIDGNLDTFFQSFWDEWTYPSLKPSGYHYITFDLKKDINAFKFKYWNRKNNGSRPKTVNLYGSQDGASWTRIEQLDNLPTEGGSTYSSDLFVLENPISHLKYEVIKGSDEYQAFFSLAEIEFYEVVRELIDPDSE